MFCSLFEIETQPLHIQNLISSAIIFYRRDKIKIFENISVRNSPKVSFNLTGQFAVFLASARFVLLDCEMLDRFSSIPDIVLIASTV